MLIVTKKSNMIYVKVDFAERDHVKRHYRGAVWSPQDRAWAAPATISTYRNLLKICVNDELNPDKLGPQMRTWIAHVKAVALRLRELQEGKTESSKNISFPEGFELPVKPFLHQQQAIAFCMNLPKAALWLDLGLGKTYTSIAIARLRHFKQQVRNVIILAPRSLLKQWGDEIKAFTPKDESYSVHLCIGTPKKKAQVIDEYLKMRHKPNHLAYLVCTYESIGSYAESIYLSTDMFILDEATKIKNPSAIRTKNTVELCKAIKYGLELTGLAYLNDPRDLFGQILAVDATVYGTNLWEFGNDYLKFTKMGAKSIPIGAKNIKELKSRAYYVAFSRKKQDCLDLPEKVYQKRMLPMYPEQQKYYKQFADELKDELTIGKAKITAPSSLTRLEKMGQILAGFIKTDDGDNEWLGSPKYDEMIDIINSSTDSFVVWGRHRVVLEMIETALTKAGIACKVLSKLSPEKADLAKKGFRKGLFKVAICQINSESKGLNLTGDQPVSTIYLENSMSIDDRWQSESRTHRIGMTGTATYIDLCIEDSLDESIVEMLKCKLKISDYIATYGLEVLFGKGGSVTPAKLKARGKSSTKTSAREEAIIAEELDALAEELKGLEGF